MKSLIWTLFLLVGISFTACSQDFPGLDASPADIAYFPGNFAHKHDPGTHPVIKVIYSRPQKKGRDIFGDLVPYGKVWRTGANESTEIKFFQNVQWNGEPLKAGTYSLFTIPGKDEWTVILNKDVDAWGAYSYNEDQDALRVKVPVKQLDDTVEALTIRFDEINRNSGEMQIAWDKTVAVVPFTY